MTGEQLDHAVDGRRVVCAIVQWNGDIAVEWIRLRPDMDPVTGRLQEMRSIGDGCGELPGRMCEKNRRFL